jgi:hypothetical protein
MMRAKLRVARIEKCEGIVQENLTFYAVSKSDGYPEDGSDENNTFARWTPSAELKISIQNPNLIRKFTEGQEFYVDFTPVPVK